MSKVRFEYNGYHFTPYMELAANYEEKAANLNHSSRLFQNNDNFSYKDFYNASPRKECDLFRCEENGKIYIPAYNMLEYKGELHGLMVDSVSEESNDYYPKYEGILPDPNISLVERNEYGYVYDGLLPLTQERALELFENGDTVYRLYENNAEGMVENREELLKFGEKGGIFGIEVECWERSSIYSEMVNTVENNNRHGDKFYVDKENQTVTWIYFNPDSEAGGQYVHNKFDFSLIEQADKENETIEGIFDYIGSACKQHLTDIDTEDFAEVDKSFKNDPYDFEDCSFETFKALKSLANEIQPTSNIDNTEKVTTIPMQNSAVELKNDNDYILPDPAIGFSEISLYGYSGADMLPLLKDRALELFDQDHTIYMLYADNTEAMVFSRSEISSHSGIFGIEAAEWIASKEYAVMVKALDNGEASKETALIFGTENAYAIYQLKSGDETRNYRFESFDRLEELDLSVDRNNYALIYSAPLNDGDTPDSLYAKFNFDRPEHFTGHSLSVSDVIVIQKDGIVTSNYIDSIGFKKLPAFLGDECVVSIEQNQSYVDLLQEHINNHADAGYLTEAEENLLIDKIDSLNTKMLERSSLYENGMPLDVETDTIDRLFSEELAKSRECEQAAPVKSKNTVHNSNVKKTKPSLLSQLEKNKSIVAQGNEVQKNEPKRDNNKEV